MRGINGLGPYSSWSWKHDAEWYQDYTSYPRLAHRKEGEQIPGVALESWHDLRFNRILLAFGLFLICLATIGLMFMK